MTFPLKTGVFQESHLRWKVHGEQKERKAIQRGTDHWDAEGSGSGGDAPDVLRGTPQSLNSDVWKIEVSSARWLKQREDESIG